MSDHYDRLENRTPAARESALFRDVRHVLAVSKPRVPALRAQLKGVDVARLMSRADLVEIPVVRHADVVARQLEAAPFGGLVATRLGALGKVFLGADSTVSVEGAAKDWWGTGRGLYAAGLRKGQLVLNCLSYDLAPHGPMFESGARAIGCPIVAAGRADLDRTVDAVARLRPSFFCGDAEHLKALLDHGADRGVDMGCIVGAQVIGALGHGLRREFDLRGIAVRHAFVTCQLGLVAYETGPGDGMTLNEGLLLEIVTPGTGCPTMAGATGEIVVTRVNADYPLVRFATGFLSSVLPQPSACGRTNTRLRAPRASEPVSRQGLPVNQAHICEIAKHFPTLGRMRVAMRHRRERDELHLKIEHGTANDALGERVCAMLHLLTDVPGTVEFVTPGSLSDEDAIIVDERSVN